ncbi:putative DNA repair protein XPGC [Klebsormidium nitens]|uniref:Flap endonuclease 1 n=1 Tax=Klebsormidium nitens TaxID=105231 RepID=A0A1Y1HUF1_KLENI|nr:putative DNA repair protein XPGC [Klebsormidium nitens]|eukprot:GAQ79478.1 putative DNA repair protein XPGC [Klebsormidium nitens]
MGVKGLTKLLADNAPRCMREQKFENYFGRRIAIDASMSIYSFLIVIGRTGQETLTNEAGESTSHLQGMFTRTIRLVEAGMKPLYVFDGKPPELKTAELKKRLEKRTDATAALATAQETGEAADIEKYSKRTVRVSRQQNEDCRKLLRLMGVPVVEAPAEAEAECANLCKLGKVYGASTEDMDALTFGTPRLIRHLMEPAARKIPAMEFELDKILEELALTMDQFIDLCILSGCDYCDPIKGIGGITALKLVRQHGSIEKILEAIDTAKYQIASDWPYKEARKMFQAPEVTPADQIPEFKWVAPDEEGIKKFLVDENGFNHERVTKGIEKLKASRAKGAQGRLDTFFKITPGAGGAAPKRKAEDDKGTKGAPAKKGKGASTKAAAPKGKKK